MSFFEPIVLHCCCMQCNRLSQQQLSILLLVFKKSKLWQFRSLMNTGLQALATNYNDQNKLGRQFTTS